MMIAGVEMQQYHTEPKLRHVGDDNLCAISLGKEDEEFADTLRMAVALTSPLALLRAVRLHTIVIYLTESEFHLRNYSYTPSARRLDGEREEQGRASSGTGKGATCGHITSTNTSRPSPTTTNNDPNSPCRSSGKGKGAAHGKHTKKQARGRSRSGGITRNRNRSKSRLSGTRDSDNDE
eukprot:jgi/Tetstr1/432758/TSEL_022124.t1